MIKNEPKFKAKALAKLKDSLAGETCMFLFMLLVIFVVFRKPIFLGEPFNYPSDCLYLDFPFRYLAWESIRNGEWPLWNPYNSGGINLLGQPFNFLVYPLYDIVYLFPKEKLFVLLSYVQIIHLVIAFCAMYYLLKNITSDTYISIWGSTYYIFAYPVVDAFFKGQLLSSYAYLPLIIYTVCTMENRGVYLNIFFLSLYLFLMVASGFPQWTLFALIITILIILCKDNPFSKEKYKKYLIRLAIVLASGAIAFLIGAIEFIPFIEQNVHGARGNIDFVNSNTQQNWVPPIFLCLRLIIPNLFDSNLQEFVNNPMIFLEDNFNSYFGILPFVLCLTQIIFFNKKGRRFWNIIFIFIFLVAIGETNTTNIIYNLSLKADLVYTRFASFLPVVGIILAASYLRECTNNKKQLRILLCFSMAVIIALIGSIVFLQFFGKQTFGHSLNYHFLKKEIFKGTIFIFLNFTVLLLFKKEYISRDRLCIFLCFFSIFEMQLFTLHSNNNIKYLEVRNATSFFEMSESEKRLKEIMGDNKYNYRIHNTSVRLEELVKQTNGPYFHYYPNANIFNKYIEANGYILNIKRDIGQLLTNTKNGYFIRTADLLLYNSLPRILSIKYIVADKNFDLENPEPLRKDSFDTLKSHKIRCVFEDGNIKNKIKMMIAELNDIPPRYYFTEGIEFIQEREEIFKKVIEPAFNPMRSTLFEEFVENKKYDTRNQKIGEINIPNANKVNLKVKTDTQGVLVCNNFWHKWWKVKINGKAGKIYRVNFNFQAIFVPAGNSEIEFYCEAISLKIGMYISFLGLLLLLTIFIMHKIKKKPPI